MTKKSKLKSWLIKTALIIASLAFVIVGFTVVSNLIIVKVQSHKIASDTELLSHNAECILILGAGVTSSGKPSEMLKERLNEGLRLYNLGMAPKIVVSGDHGREYYDEVNVMKNFLVDAGVPSEDIFMDHAGFSTYESMYRAKEIFGIKRMIVVTQKYHLYRALYISNHLGIDTLGANATKTIYYGQDYRNMREILARVKDVFTTLFRVKPTFMGDKIDITGDGNVTND